MRAVRGSVRALHRVCEREYVRGQGGAREGLQGLWGKGLRKGTMPGVCEGSVWGAERGCGWLWVAARGMREGSEGSVVAL